MDSNRKIMVLDCESTGKPLNYRGVLNDVKNWPRISQLSYQVYDFEKEELLKVFDSLIKPDGWVIPTEQFFIDNNMSTERCEAEGIPMNEVLDEFIIDLSECDIMVCHNVSFDYPCVICELIRYKKNVLNTSPVRKICTMQESTDFCKLPGQYGKYKWPKLEELHRILFKEEFDGAHDAGSDVTACARCFFELVRLEVISI